MTIYDSDICWIIIKIDKSVSHVNFYRRNESLLSALMIAFGKSYQIFDKKLIPITRKPFLIRNKVN